MNRAATFEVGARCGDARTGRVATGRGSFSTPCFMPVGTRAGVRAVSTADLEDLGFEVMLANTYHLMLRPGMETVARLGGIHGFSAWDGQVLTDSGGYQVFSLGARYDEEGVAFRSVYDGSSHRLTPEDAVAIQAGLGSDIQMVLDVCAPLPSPVPALREAMELTLRWATRAVGAHRLLANRGEVVPAIFGIVQGGDDMELRTESARATAALGFDGYGIGGLSVGEPPEVRREALAAALAELPADRPRYLMGVGDPAGVVEAIAMGVDMFDCVLPTRLARHGTALTSQGRLSIKRAAFSKDPGPLDPSCSCPVCHRWSRAYLRHLAMVADPAVLRLLSLHNLAWIFGLISRARRAVEEGSLAALAKEVGEVYPV